MGPARQSFFGYNDNKDFRARFPMTQLDFPFILPNLIKCDFLGTLKISLEADTSDYSCSTFINVLMIMDSFSEAYSRFL